MNDKTEADELLAELLGVSLESILDKGWTEERIAYTIKRLAWKLNESLPEAAPVEVHSSLIIEGKGNAGGGSYEINAV